ncbi:MAG TPA: ATP-dependent acyl-CoA ligase, partial [Spirochaetes bacterium]|nr:ATP-dependent acyl-CoA ligase [Spirochaetota bacterium]
MGTKAHLNQVIASHLVEIRAEEQPDTRVYIFERGEHGEDVCTYADLYEKSNRIARLLLEKGIGKGDSFAVFMRNYPEFVYSLLAGTTIGAVMVPIDPRNRGDRLKFLLNNCGAKAVIVSAESLDMLTEVLGDVPSIKLVSVVYRPELKVPADDRYHAMNEVLEASAWERVDQQIMDERHPMQIIYTSGTTGDPKGVAIRNNRTGLFNI